MLIGFRPAGFIMNMTMKTAMMAISPDIIMIRISDRYSARSNSRMIPTLTKDASSMNDARTIESTRNTSAPVTTLAMPKSQNAMSTRSGAEVTARPPRLSRR